MPGFTTFFVPGPADVSVGTGAAKAMQFLGWTRDGAHVREDLLRRPVMSDYAGPEMPADYLMVGKMVVISMRLVRFDPTVMSALMARYFTGLAGSIEANGIGTLAKSEGATFPLIIKSRYQAAKTLYASNLPGIRVLDCWLDQSHGYTLSTVEQEHELTFMGMTTMNASTLTGTLWDTNVSGAATPT